MADADVLAKAKAASEWCRHASEHARTCGGKEWTYFLIPHDEVGPQRTLAALVERFSRAEA